MLNGNYNEGILQLIIFDYFKNIILLLVDLKFVCKDDSLFIVDDISIAIDLVDFHFGYRPGEVAISTKSSEYIIFNEDVVFECFNVEFSQLLKLKIIIFYGSRRMPYLFTFT